MPSKDLSPELSSKTHIPPCILLLNGFPGVGKLTIAKALTTILDSNSTSYELLDDHQIIDPLTVKEPVRHERHYQLRTQERRSQLQRLGSIEEDRLIVVMTSCLCTSESPTPFDDVEQFEDFVHLSETRQVPLVMVNLLCDLERNRERLWGRKGKTRNPKELEKMSRGYRLIDRETVLRCGRERVLYFEFDTTLLNLERETQKVVEFLGRVEGGSGRG